MSTPSSIGQARRERERKSHRRSILEAAERIFVDKGYAEATIEAIAHEAEFAAGTIYNFFSGKEELFLAVADRILDDMIERFAREVEPLKDRPKEAITSYIGLRLDEIRRHEAFMHLFHPSGKALCTAAKAGDPPDARREKFRAHLNRVHVVFAEGIRQGVLHAEVSPEDMAGVVEGALRFFHRLWSRQGVVLTHQQGLARLSKSLMPLLWAHPESDA